MRSRGLRRVREWLIKAGLFLCVLFTIGITLSIIGVLGQSAAKFFLDFDEVTLSGFFGSLSWHPPLVGANVSFGIWALVNGTLLITGIAMLLALPLGLITAIYMSEYAPGRVRGALKPVLEVLAGIPTVVYGFFALMFISPALRFQWTDWVHNPLGFEFQNATSAGIAVGILCLPIVSSLCEDALQAVPRGLREGAYGLGGTKADVSARVVLPAALSGVISAFLLAIARAIGETMIVVLAAGNTPIRLGAAGGLGETLKTALDPTQAAQTMTGFMVQMALGDVSNYSMSYFSLYAVAAMLFLLTFTLTLVGAIIRRRFREAYE